MVERLLSIADVLERTGLSRPMLDKHRRGETRTPFPEPAEVYGQSPVWIERDVDEWLTLPRPVGKPPAEPR